MTIEKVPISTALGRAYLEDNIVRDCTLLPNFTEVALSLLFFNLNFNPIPTYSNHKIQVRCSANGFPSGSWNECAATRPLFVCVQLTAEPLTSVVGSLDLGTHCSWPGLHFSLPTPF